jgi:predicted membrane-bound spermidine synthase
VNPIAAGTPFEIRDACPRCGGMCGIAYEIIYARLLTTYLGDAYFVSAAILATFLLGIAIGALAAKRLLRWLWAVELSIGLYSAAVALGSHHYSQALLGRLCPLLGGRPAAVTLAVLLFLIVPAVLVGASVPLFAAYCRGHAGDRRAEAWFESVYSLYNLGAAVCVMLIEFLLLRALGLRATLLVVASVNLMSALRSSPQRFSFPSPSSWRRSCCPRTTFSTPIGESLSTPSTGRSSSTRWRPSR